MSDHQQPEWLENETRVQTARAHVLTDISMLLAEHNGSGRGQTVDRIGRVNQAITHGDIHDQRAAIIDLSVTAAAWAAELDMKRGQMPR